jgi:GGDEF domain-containing protein
MNMMATKDFLNKLIQTCPGGIIGIDRKGTVIIFNPTAEKLTGRSAKFQLRADLAMYEAKKAGGNRVVVASEQIGV